MKHKTSFQRLADIICVKSKVDSYRPIDLLLVCMHMSYIGGTDICESLQVFASQLRYSSDLKLLHQQTILYCLYLSACRNDEETTYYFDVGVAARTLHVPKELIISFVKTVFKTVRFPPN